LEELIKESGLESDIDYRFKHELTKDAAYEQLLLRRRRELHGRVGYELVRLYGRYEEEIAEDLAHHYLVAERWFEAARWSLTAAQAAKRLYAMHDAMELCETALTAIGKVERSPSAAGVTGPDTHTRPRDEVGLLHAAILIELLKIGLLTRVHEDPEKR